MVHDLIKYIKNAPDQIKNQLIGILINASMGLSNAENQALHNTKDLESTSSDDNNIDIGYHKNDLLSQMKRGEMNEQYVKYYYTLLKRADDFINKSNKNQILEALEKNGMKLDSEGSNMEMYSYLNNVDTEYKKQTNKLNENYGFNRVISIRNNVFLKNQHETNPTPNSYDTTIKCSRNIETNNRIELYTEYLNVYNKLTQYNFQFYIPQKYPINKIENDFTNITFIDFIDQYGEKYIFKINRYSGYFLKDGNNIVMFSGTKVENI